MAKFTALQNKRIESVKNAIIKGGTTFDKAKVKFNELVHNQVERLREKDINDADIRKITKAVCVPAYMTQQNHSKIMIACGVASSRSKTRSDKGSKKTTDKKGNTVKKAVSSVIIDLYTKASASERLKALELISAFEAENETCGYDEFLKVAPQNLS